MPALTPGDTVVIDMLAAHKTAGIGELASAVASFRGVKPTVAYAGDLAPSAGYWLASAADSTVIGRGAALGSIGVRAAYAAPSAEDAGVLDFVSSQPPFKKADLSTEEGRNRIPARIDAMAQVFAETVASKGGVPVDRVLSDFGRGDVLIRQAAVDAGMADAIGTFEGTLARLAAGSPPARRAPAPKSLAPRVGTPMAPIGAPKALVPIPTPPPVPVVPPAVAADRVRVLAIRDATPSGAEAERDEAIRSGASVEEFRQLLGAFEILSAMRASRGG